MPVNWARLEWRWRLFKKRLREMGGSFAPRARSEAANLKTCRNCRALIARTARTCPECGTRLGWFASRARSGSAGAGFFADSPATGALLVAILGLFLATWVASGLGPGGPSSGILLRFGAFHARVFRDGEYWRLLTAVFLHGGFVHIMFNSAALYQLGPAVESIYSWARMLVLFVGAGLLGSAVSVLYHDRVQGVGASGAIFGLIGVIAVFGYRRGGSYGDAVMRTAIQWAVFGLAFGFLGPLIDIRVDNAAHIGGLIGGAALAFVVPPERERVSVAWNAAGIIAAALVPVAFAFAFLNVSWAR